MAYGYGLDKPEGMDGFGQLLKGLLVEGHSGLEGVGLYHPDGNPQDVGGILGLFRPCDFLVDVADGLAERLQAVFVTEYGSEASAKAV